MIPKIIKTYNTLYLPYSHFWDLPFIWLFKILNKKIILTVHDGILHTGEKNFITQTLNNFRIYGATELIFLSDHVMKNVFNHLKIQKKYSVIPHPILDNSYVKFDRINNDTTNKLLFLGRIDRYKGLEMLMRSVINNKTIDKLIIAGKSNYNIDYLVDDRIQVVDKYLDEKEIGDLLSWADVLVLPYTEATQSGVITLGIYAEKIMICTEVGGFSEQLEKDESYWCQPNENSLSKIITKAFHDKENWPFIKKKLKEKKEKLSWDNISSEVEKKLAN
ncbi:MAG: glycosyltransferase [Flavobacteriales bacterium]